MQHSTLPLWKFSPLSNLWWICGCIVVIAAQLCFGVVSLVTKPSDLSVSLAQLNWLVYLVGFACIIFLISNQEIVKWKDRRDEMRSQKRAKLEFDTRLGMHSPV